MLATEVQPVVEFQVDSLRVIVHENRARMGRAAASEVARAIADRQGIAGHAHIVFAAAPSQDEFLAALVAQRGIDWSNVVGFQMDEYLKVDPDHRGSTRRYLQERLFRWAGISPDRLHLIPGESTAHPLRVALDYSTLINREPIDIVCGGIGDNGHLAFNDPHSADFLDPVDVKVVRLDEACRQQQLADDCFRQIDDVPTHAYTWTIPALLRPPVLSMVVPGRRKAQAVLATVRGPIGEHCPATILRTHPGATLHLDRDSAHLLI